MHIPESMMHGRVCPVTATLSATFLAATAYAACKVKDKPAPARFASVSAFIFAAQMLNFPVAHGTSGHFLGGVFAAALLGIPHGIIAVSLVVSAQALLFADGGLSVLGANILNMALVGAGMGGLLRHYFAKRGAGSATATAAAAWLCVMLAALFCSAELALSGAARFAQTAGAMLFAHALTGAVEAAITVAAVKAFAGNRMVSKTSCAPAAAATAALLMLAPFASQLPDGLESAARQYGFLKEAQPLFASPLANYSFPAMSNPQIAAAMAGAAGAAAVFAASYMAARLIAGKQAA
ncbi:MAG: energy-coupling factor ABC transporter permease [Elusimicrobiales bacterium]|nr:energy-coupling factor ABC transporter permease [Elusimicrobiales bacterium]